MSKSEHGATGNKLADDAQTVGGPGNLCKMPYLQEVIELDFGLLEEMYHRQCLTFDAMEEIKSAEAHSTTRANLFLQYMQNVSDDEFKTFLSVLNKTSQPHIVNFIMAKGGDREGQSGTCEPLDQTTLISLKHNFGPLVNLLDMKKAGIVERLCAEGVITEQHKKYIGDVDKDKEKNARLLNILKRRSTANFKKFLSYLNEQQPELAKVLKRGVVAELQARFIVPVTAGDDSEQPQDDTLRPGSAAGQSSTKPAGIAMIQENVEPDEEPALGVDGATKQKEHKYSLYVLCVTPAGVQHVDKLCRDGTLKASFHDIFAILLDCDPNLMRSTLEWPVADYNRCLDYFCASEGFYSKFHKLSDIDDCDVEGSSEYYFDRIPVEVREILLMKAAVMLFKRLIRLTSHNADVLALSTLNFVCRDWWSTITARRWNRVQLRQMFKEVCSPYACRVKYVTSLHVDVLDRQDRGSKATGPCYTSAACLDGRVFVVNSSSYSVEVFTDSPPYGQREQLPTPKGRRDWLGRLPRVGWSPTDIVACTVSRRLYVSDSSNRCIWRVDVSGSCDTPTIFTKTKYIPGTMSVTSGRLLVTPSLQKATSGDGGSLFYLYDVDGKLLKTVPWHGGATVLHSLETTSGTLIVCCTGWPLGSMNDQVVELNAEGRVLRAFGGQRGSGPRKLKRPCHLALGVDGRVLVVDSGNRRILLLNSRLQLERILLSAENDTTLNEDPQRLCIGDKLFLGLTNCINIYNI